jgi:hypothetical protein
VVHMQIIQISLVDVYDLLCWYSMPWAIHGELSLHSA